MFKNFLRSCNRNSIEDVESGALAEFGGLQKKLERGEWLTLMPVWVDRSAQKEEVRRKSDVHGMGVRPSNRKGGRDAVFNHVVYPQLQIMERLGDITLTARLENLYIPLAEDGREICLRFLSKGECIRSYTRSHAPVQGHNQDSVIRYIMVGREVVDPSRKRKFDGGVDRGSHGGHWDRSGGNGTRNSEGQNHGNGARFGGRQGGHSGGIDGNHGGGGGTLEGNGNNTNPDPPPPTKTGIKCGAAVRTVRKEVGWRRGNN